MNKIFLTFLLIFCFYLSGCSSFRQAVGSEKIKLDEFSIVEKNKLIMPPTFDLTAEIQTLDNKESIGLEKPNKRTKKIIMFLTSTECEGFEPPRQGLPA